MKYFTLTVCFLVASISSNAFYMELYGTVVEHYSSDPLKSVEVRVYSGNMQVLFTKTKANGKFKFRIERETEYLVEFSKEHFVTKRLGIDTRNIPPDSDIPFFEMELEIDLFPFVEGVDYTVMDFPLGIAHYDDNLKNMTWSTKHSRKMKPLFNKFWYNYEKAFYAKRPKPVARPESPTDWPPR